VASARGFGQNNKMKILFIDGTLGYSPASLSDRPTGGISTSLTIIPRYLAAKGHEVYVKSLHDVGECVEGVHFLAMETHAPVTDVVVLNRNSPSNELVSQIIANGSTLVWWLHDIVDHRGLLDASFKKIDNIVSLSRYCTDTYSDFFEIKKEKFTIIPNAVDTSVWYPGEYGDRDPNLFVFASAPVKGFEPLAYVAYNLQRNFPKLDFRIYSSQKLHGLVDSSVVQSWLTLMKSAGANVLDPIPQKELADVFRKAWCLLSPNSYPEICSNLILQAKACGLPVVASPTGSNAELIKHRESGMLTKWLPHDKFMWWADFARQTMEVATDKELHRHISETAAKNPPTWESIGAMWEKYLNAKSAKLVSVC